MGRQERHGRLGDNDVSCSFCGHHEHRSGDCPERLGKLLAEDLAQGVRGLLRIAGEDFVKARTTEVIETAKKIKAAKRHRRPQQKAEQQKRTGGRTEKPTEGTEDKRAGKATKVQTAAGQQQEEESKKAAAEQQEEESKRAAAERQEEESRIAAKREERKERRKQKGDKENEDNAKQARTSRAESPVGRRKGNKGRKEATVAHPPCPRAIGRFA